MNKARLLIPFVTAALAFAAPATGFSHSSGGGHWGGGCSHFSSGYHGHYYGHGRGYFYGSGGPFFWGPGLGFAYYGGPGYYGSDYPGYYREYHAVRGNVSADLGEDVQRALAERGFYHGPVDGEIGPASRAAIRAYQNKHGLEPTGRIDDPLLRSLRI